MDTKQRTGTGIQDPRKRRSAAARQTQTTPQRKRTTKPTSASAASAGKRQAASAQRTRQVTARTKQQKTAKKTVATPEIVYTPAKPFSRNRLLLQLATVVAVVLALTFGISIFFKVDVVTVSGADMYSAWTVREASGIKEGDNLLTFGRMRARVNIMSQLPYVESVQIGIKLPDTVNIEIKEMDVVYSIRDESENWWTINSDGKVIEKVDGATAGEYTQVLGVKLSLPASNQQAVAVEPVPTETDASGATIPVTVRGSEQLNIALSILQFLEEEEIIGQVASVDVSDISQIEMMYGDRFRVKLGDSTQLAYKITLLKGSVSQMDPYATGELDISFTTWPDQVGYTP